MRQGTLVEFISEEPYTQKCFTIYDLTTAMETLQKKISKSVSVLLILVLEYNL